jgi:hypothetical protein
MQPCVASVVSLAEVHVPRLAQPQRDLLHMNSSKCRGETEGHGAGRRGG